MYTTKSVDVKKEKAEQIEIIMRILI